MTRTERNSHHLAALSHPLWWGALILLVVNDHVLKGAGVLPGELTGKLSDFAGMVVAPVLLCALVQAQSRRTRLACFAAVAAVFAAINLSPALAGAWDGALSSVGVAWRTFSDPTDLVGLAALPLGWWVLSAERTRLAAPVLARVGLVLGAFACMATSQPVGGDTFFQTDAFLANHTGDRVDVRVRWLDATVDCEALAEDPARILARESFGDGLTFVLEADGILPLDRSEVSRSSGFTDTGVSRGGCDAVLVQSDVLPDTVLFWRGIASQQIDISASVAAEAGFPGEVRIENADGELRALNATGTVVADDYLERHAPETCDAGYATSLEWTHVAEDAVGLQKLVAVDPGPDGCLAVDLLNPIDIGHRLFLCVPEWAFPFAPGTDIVVNRDLAGSYIGFTGEDATGTRYELFVEHAGPRMSFGSLTARAVPLVECDGGRTDCGYTLPVGLSITGVEGILLPGDIVDVPASIEGRPARVLLGRGERSALTRTSCGEEVSIEMATDVLVLFQEVL